MRITIKDLEAAVNRINRMTNSPMVSYIRTDGKLVAQIGNYHLSSAYGGFALHRMVSEGGGISDVLGCGHVSKSELYKMIHAFIRGLEYEGNKL